jgi:citrate synthase
MNAAYRPGLEDVVATDTTVSFLDLDREQIVVRGYDLIELASGVRYPDVAHLLIYGSLPDARQQEAFCRALADNARLPDGLWEVLRSLPPDTVAMDALRTGLSVLAGFEDPEVLEDNGRDANVGKAVRLLARAPAIAVNAYRALHGLDAAEADPARGFAGGFLQIIPGADDGDDAVRVFDRVLICYSEHELANSTLTARVAASTLTDIYGAVVAATAALKGPLHGGANEAAARMFAEIADRGGSAVAEPYVTDRLAARARIMGFGHRVYMHRPDPRALLLKADLDAVAARDAEAADFVRSYEICAATMEREKGLYPNADLPIGLIMFLLRIPIDLYTPIFLCARLAGLVAHVIEQHEHNRLFRPRVLYEGPRDLSPPEGYVGSTC